MKELKKGLYLMVMLMLVVVGTSLVTGTYAKYTSSVKGTSETKIAGWAWDINQTALAKETTTYELKLFETIKDSNAIDEETDVKANLIAPGTTGSFDITIKNNSEVDAVYKYEFNVENTLGAKIQWSDDNASWTDTIASLNATDELAVGSEEVKKTIYWKWVFDESADQDVQDTEVGFDAAATNTEKDIIVTADLTLTQID